MFVIHRAILETIVYYDVFEYPLTEFEVWKLLLASDGDGESVSNISLSDVRGSLRGSFLSKRIGRVNGFVFLRGREKLVALRVRREKLASKNISIARRIANILRFFPFVRMVGLTGSLSMKNVDRDSDIDFLIVLRSGYIWTGRAIATALLHLFGLRRYGTKVSRRACLNFWVSSSSLEIRFKDIFSSNEYLFIIPLFGERVFRKFQETNMWIRRFRPHFELPVAMYPITIADTLWSQVVRDVGEVLFAGLKLENVLRVLQKKKIDANPKTRTPEGIISATDDALIFLPHPRGPEVFEKFRQRMSEVEASVVA